jgi:single-strand DNA-binding protein
MATLNKVLLIGNLTRDPEVRYTPAGMAVSDLRMAVSRKFKTANGEEREETCFVSVTVWGRQAETCGEYLRKGSSAFIEGRLKFDEWEKDGQKLNRLTVVAERVQFLGSPRRGEVGDAPPSGEKRPGRPAPAAPAAPEEPPPPAGEGEGGEDLPF